MLSIQHVCYTDKLESAAALQCNERCMQGVISMVICPDNQVSPSSLQPDKRPPAAW